jgi:hypothetical protein
MKNKVLMQLMEWIDTTPSINRKLLKEKIEELDNASVTKPKTKRVAVNFIPPSVEEIRTYCLLRNNNVDPEMFFDFYQSKGWLVGKVKMRDWKAAIRTWEKSSNNNNSNQNKDGRQQPLLGRQSADTVRANASGWNNAE